MKALIGSKGSCRSLTIPVLALFASVLVLGGVTFASNMGFKLNYGIIKAANALFQPSGYDNGGGWTGQGSGLSLSLSIPEGGANTVALNLTTPPGRISLPYSYEVMRHRRTGRMRPAVRPATGDPAVRFGGTNFNFDLRKPLTFASSDGVAEISIFIFSKPEANPSVRYSGTGNIVRNDAGQVEVESFIGTDEVWIKIGDERYIWQRAGGVWTLVNQP